jgi:hypothetical protein
MPLKYRHDEDALGLDQVDEAVGAHESSRAVVITP